MKKWFGLLVCCLFSLLFSEPLQDRGLEQESVTELLELFAISKNSNMVEEMQKLWLRRPGQERWEMAEIPAEKKPFVLEWADKTGMLDAVEPVENFYDTALILGATTFTMKERLLYLKKLWEEGVRFKEVVWLTGDRPLDPRVETLLERCENETEAAKVIWEETDLPEEIRSLPCSFISLAMKVGRRPNTKDTIIAWVEKGNLSSKALFISSQPFCAYQFAVIKNCLPDTITFDVVGDRVISKTHPSGAAIILDTVARTLYEQNLGSF
ncbi:MAG: hypothetical protein JSR76_05275 [Verrucomicrobia bacterium]|nr:hypothetical protein [Verrucomicrobiota bacterium]